MASRETQGSSSVCSSGGTYPRDRGRGRGRGRGLVVSRLSAVCCLSSFCLGKGRKERAEARNGLLPEGLAFPLFTSRLSGQRRVRPPPPVAAATLTVCHCREGNLPHHPSTHCLALPCSLPTTTQHMRFLLHCTWIEKERKKKTWAGKEQLINPTLLAKTRQK